MHAPDSQPVSARLGWSSAAKLLGTVLLILGAKLWTLRVGSAPLPVFDQWESEGQHLLQPWLHHQFHLHDLFVPWVQHRIVWTRLIVLGLLRINRQWDTQLEAIISELIHAGAALLLGAILIRRLGRRWEDAVLLCLLLLFSLPIALANTLSGGFASQYYVLLLFAVVAVWGLGSARPGSAGWWTGVAGAVAAWFSVATGALPSFAVAAWMALRLARREGSARENRLTLGVALALGAAGLSLAVSPGDLDVLKPRSAGELLVRFLGLLGWPNPTAWAAPVAYAPFSWLLWRTLRDRRRATGPVEAFLIPFGFFVLLNTAALAYARNRYGDLQVSRYMDFLSLGALVNFLSLLPLLRDAATGAGDRARALAPVGLLASVWVVGAGFGLVQITSRNLADTLPSVKTCSQREIGDVAAFVARHDPGALVRGAHLHDLCDNPALAASLLQDPEILRVLPAQVRSPVRLELAAASPTAHRVDPAADGETRADWALEPSQTHQPVYFRSQVVNGSGLPYLRFPLVTGLGDDALIALVDERSGATTWLQPGCGSILTAPSGPFHVEAALAAGASGRLAFACPRDVGCLSAWVDPLLDSAPLLLCAGAASWLGAVFWRRLGLHALAGLRWRLPALARKSTDAAPGGAVYTR